ncbi:MAG: heme lyase CcmF/NrfE family subunit [Actinobacteria bacterium]|nr:heme lyase CcmF/NrfE family subunit [Actinomycetota bacterium]
MPLQVQDSGLTGPLGSLGSLGRPALLAALAFALIGLTLCALGAARDRRDLAAAGIRAVVATAAFVAFATFCLLTAFFAHDFSLDYVASYSSRSLTGPYTLTALWGGVEGSLLLWTFLLTVFAAIALTRAPARRSALVAWAGAVLCGISIFFLVLLAVPANPFAALASVPADGQGLNPLLQSPGMLIHPPLLYTGFVGFSIPFAFCIAALITRRLDDSWLRATRRWTLFAWSALSVGIVLGGAWAYTELGWGGYWAWDPVENASFMPWLTATAFLHSVVIQEKRRMLKVWNVSLILLTYVLAVFGTFLTRSGILSSIHTFAEGDTGKWFLPYLAVMLLGGLVLIGSRLDSLRSENRFDSLLSRESAFLANNVLFVAAGFAVLWGTVYPIVNEAFSGVRLSVGPPFFNRVFAPIGLALVALAGIGPLISWRRMSKGTFARVARPPALAGVAAVIVLAAGGVRSIGALLALGISVFTAAAIVGEFARGSRVHRRREGSTWPESLRRTLTRNRRRYGGYIVHLGIVLMVIGFSGNAFKVERSAELAPNESMTVGAYSLTYVDHSSASTPEKEINEAVIAVSRGGERIATLRPQRNFHIAQRQTQSEVAIRTTPAEDLYLVVTSFDADATIVLRSFVNPLTWWIWAGAAVMLAGMAVLLWAPAPQAVPGPAPVRVRRTEVATR